MGSRKRFLYRLIIYPFLPLLGLYLIWSRWGDPQAALMGLLALIMGLTAIYLFFGRLRRPWLTTRYALNPLGAVRQALSSAAQDPLEANSDQLEKMLTTAFPDLEVQLVPLPQSRATCLRLGEELLLCLRPTLNSPREVEQFADALQQVRRALHPEPLLLLLTRPTEGALLAQLRERLPRLSVYGRLQDE